MVLSRTMTEPTNLRSQVEREATTRAMAMKYSSQDALSMAASYNHPMDAGMLECPNCGAPARVDQQGCTHCKVQLQTVACPTCFGMLFIGAKHCSHCGTRAFVGRTTAEMPAAGGGSSCPRCKAVLAMTAIGEAF